MNAPADEMHIPTLQEPDRAPPQAKIKSVMVPFNILAINLPSSVTGNSCASLVSETKRPSLR